MDFTQNYYVVGVAVVDPGVHVCGLGVLVLVLGTRHAMLCGDGQIGIADLCLVLVLVLGTRRAMLCGGGGQIGIADLCLVLSQTSQMLGFSHNLALVAMECQDREEKLQVAFFHQVSTE